MYFFKQENGLSRKEIHNIRPSHIHAWRHFNQIRNSLVCMEVGVERGDNAYCILETLTPKKLVLVDRWENYIRDNGENYMNSSNNYSHVCERYKGWSEVEIIKDKSQNYLLSLKDNSFDYVYIDGSHDKLDCLKDIINAVRLVKVNGIIGGHDYGHPGQVVVKNMENIEVPFAVWYAFDNHYVFGEVSDWWIVNTQEIKDICKKINPKMEKLI